MKVLLSVAATCLALIVGGPSVAESQTTNFLPDNPTLLAQANPKKRVKKRSRKSRRRRAAKRRREAEARKSRDIALYSIGVGSYLAAPVALIALGGDDLPAGRAVVFSNLMVPFGPPLIAGGIAVFFSETGGRPPAF